MIRDGEDFSFRRIALPAFGPSLLFGLSEGAILPVIALTARDLGASVAVAALVVTLIGVGSLISNIPASIITAKYGERWALVGAAALSAAAMVLCLSARVLWVYTLGVLVVGSAFAVFNLARQKYLTEAVPVSYRARALSSLGGVMRIGVFCGPFLGALAIQLLGLAGAYWVGAAGAIAAGLIALFLPDLPERQLSDHQQPGKVTVRGVMAAHRGVFLTMGLAILLVSAVRSSRQAALPLWAEYLGLDAATTSLIYGLSGAVDMLVFYQAGKLMDRRGRIWVAVPSMLIMGVSLLVMPLTSQMTGLLIVALVIGFGNGIGSGLVMTLGADYSPDDGRAQFLGVWRLMADLGSASGPVLLSTLTGVLSLAAGISATGFVGLLAAAALWYWIPRRKPFGAH